MSALTPLDEVDEEKSGAESEVSVEEARREPEESEGLLSDPSDSDASDVSSDSVSSVNSASTSDSEQPTEEEVAEPKTPPTSPTLKRENARDAKDVKNAQATAKMKKYIEKQQLEAQKSVPRHLFL